MVVMQDGVRVMKCSLDSFCRDDALRERLREHALRAHRVVTETYHLIHLDLRERYESALRDDRTPEEPPWTKQRVKQFLYAATTSERAKVVLPDALAELVRTQYDPLREEHALAKERRDYLGGNWLEETANRIAAAIETNVREHFFQRQFRYVRLRDQLGSKSETAKRVRKINAVAAPGNQTDDSLPTSLDATITDDLEAHPERFLWPMWNMNRAFEAAGAKKFAVLPLPQGFVPGASYHVDSDTLRSLVGTKDARLKSYYDRCDARRRATRETSGQKRGPPGKKLDPDVLDENDLLWSPFFDLRSVARGQNVRFGHHLTTDGVSVSVTVLGRATEATPPASSRAKRKRARDDDSLPDVSMFAGVDVKKVVGVDPGKHDLVHMTNDSSPRRSDGQKAKTLRYTAAQRRHESGAKYREARVRKPPDVQELEDALSGTDSRVTGLKAFQEYLSARFAVQERLYAHYGKPVYRIHRWQTWRDRRSSEDRFVERAVQTFGKDAVLAYGDWSAWHGMKGLPSSPTNALRRRLAQRLRVVDIPEFRTTKTCSRCHGMVAGDPSRLCTLKDGRKVPTRGIRRCNSDLCGGLLRWNRDHNAAINMRETLLHRIRTGEWHPAFRRGAGEDPAYVAARVSTCPPPKPKRARSNNNEALLVYAESKCRPPREEVETNDCNGECCELQTVNDD
ncbi:Hypothetical protein UVM_LOCUS91 [uncultured virus]|nr:Hypothetical protein UVM_LOCUS91 [uncultured virus]